MKINSKQATATGKTHWQKWGSYRTQIATCIYHSSETCETRAKHNMDEKFHGLL